LLIWHHLIKIICCNGKFTYNCAVIPKRKIAAIILSAIYIFSSSTASEFFKLPKLINHYYDHRDENSSVTLSMFLVQHYYYEDGTDKDVEEDNKLPFKSAENANAPSLVSLTPPPLVACASNPNKEISRDFGVYKKLFLPSRYLKNIWQPPRPRIAFTV